MKERTIGIEVFGRHPDYDTNADTVVRYTAGEVRKRLTLYYSSAPDAPIQILLSARSYQPEFYKVIQSERRSPDDTFLVPLNLGISVLELKEPETGSLVSASVQTSSLWSRPSLFQKLVAGTVLLALLLVAIVAGPRLWRWHLAAAADRFWTPVIDARGPVLICPGAVVIGNGTNGGMGVAVPQNSAGGSYVSFESGLAIGRITSLLSSRGSDYKILPSSSIKFDQFREGAVILIGAYNNGWTQRLLQPLRFHFNPEPSEGIVDSQNPQKVWSRDPSRPITDKPDYALVARFRDPATDSIIVVIAGLKQYGTDAASQFAVSSAFLNGLDRIAGKGWKNKNIEVVLRTDVANGSAGVPIIEAVHVW